jgi:hypothetical protein
MGASSVTKNSTFWNFQRCGPCHFQSARKAKIADSKALFARLTCHIHTGYRLITCQSFLVAGSNCY